MLTFIPDIVLILTSGIACLYCVLLSRRLKKLQSLEGGLGASILSLTEAIAKTNEAAQHARRSTEDSVAVLQKLIHDAQETMPKIEARIESLRYSRIAATTAHAKLDKILDNEVKTGLQEARQTSQSLLQIVHEISDYQRRAKIEATPKPSAAKPPQGKAA